MADQSILEVDSVVNKAGTGAPDFPNGQTVSSGAEATPSITTTSDTNTGIYFPAADTVGVSTGGTERMRIDSSGNVLVGTSDPLPSSNNDANGIALRADGNAQFSRSGAATARFNRGTTNGEIVSFHKNGASIGNIGNTNAGSFGLEINGQSGYIGINTGQTTGGVVFFGNDYTSVPRVQPINDNAVDLGAGSNRWDDIYATNSTIQTSDRNEKQDIEELSEAEQRVAVAAKGLLRKYRWKSAVAEKGDGARVHFGIIAQDLQSAFEAEGLDAGRYGMFIYSEWWEFEETYIDDDGVEQTRTDTYYIEEEAPEGAVKKSRMGVRYSELLAFIISAI